ncbi:MAG: hypothetical protein K0S46_861 [Moraxellaceae bacterium]|jgi:hypothetical protein|nr:hypothetical protein [Moraxellaceae bacterium]
MTTNRWLMLGFAVLAVLVVLAGRWLWNDSEGEVAATPEEGSVVRPIADTRLPALPPTGEVAPPPLAGSDSPLVPMPESTVDAAESMAKAMEHGDPQAPKVVRDAPREAPTAAELADPAAYQRYEARQNQRLYSQYVQAADQEIPRLQADIQRAKAAGLPPEQIAEGEEKLRRIQAMRDQLQADNPGIR